MTTFVPLGDLADYQSLLHTDNDWRDQTNWVPVSTTELHLACRYYPVAVSFAGQVPRLGLIVDQRYIAYPLHDANGQWLGAYRPIGIRCFPFKVRQIGDDPLTDLGVDADSATLMKKAGPRGVPRGQIDGRLAELHRLCCLLRRSEASFSNVVDQLLIAGLLLPLKDESDPNVALHVVDPDRVLQIGKAALGALGRHNFLGIDVALACLFSLRNLKPQFRPTGTNSSSTALAPASTIPEPIDDLGLAIDDGELIGLGCFSQIHAETAAAHASNSIQRPL